MVDSLQLYEVIIVIVLLRLNDGSRLGPVMVSTNGLKRWTSTPSVRPMKQWLGPTVNNGDHCQNPRLILSSSSRDKIICSERASSRARRWRNEQSNASTVRCYRTVRAGFAGAESAAGRRREAADTAALGEPSPVRLQAFLRAPAVRPPSIRPM